MVVFLLLIIGAYLLGAVPSAYLVARWRRGIDLRQYGSGNVGAANVMTAVSRQWGLPVIVFDIVKGMAPTYTAQALGLGVAQQIAIGLAVIIGHNWTVFLGFNGGRGMLTTLGVSLVLAPKLILIFLTAALVLGLFRLLSLGTILALVALPVCSYFFPEPFGITIDPQAVSLGFLAILVISVIRRLTVPRTAIAASVSTRELLVNRLLFDRDIRDREAWTHRTPEIKSRQSPEPKTR